MRAAQIRTPRNDTLNQHTPTLIIIAGPLGAGKTTFYEAYLQQACPTLTAAVRDRQRPRFDDRRSFAVEDTRVDMRLLDEAKEAGYRTAALFISTEDANLNVGRVLVRMSQGGKAEAGSGVINSYREATKNLAEVRKHADELIVYDNTAYDRGYRVVAHFTRGELTRAAETIPAWAAKVFGKQLQPPKHRAKPGRTRK